jgi:hypothetical protein
MPEEVKQIPDVERAAWGWVARELGNRWCDLMHDSPTWPIHGQYRCSTCGRRHPVPWATDNTARAAVPPITAEPARTGQPRVPSFGSASVPRVILLAVLLVSTVRAGDVPLVGSTAEAGRAFARYTLGAEQADSWSLETVEIDASLPKLKKQGRLSAIRRLLPLGRPEYQVLEIAGDQTVRQQVIFRYLSAEVRAAALPTSSIAITPANYRFHYKGPVKAGKTVAFAFLITPRKKQEGLIKGELWLDGETGAVVRQSGYLVKKPSVLVKRVDVTRETTLQDGIAAMRVTHLSVDTRLVGRAELTIHERPCDITSAGPAVSFAER